MSAQRGYVIRHYVNGRAKHRDSEWKNYSITVPSEIAEALPSDLKFIPRMTEQGLLYEPVKQTQTKIELPDWAKKESENKEEINENKEQ